MKRSFPLELMPEQLQVKHESFNHIKLIRMDITLKKLKDIVSENCVTIIMNTHRTSPDNKMDPTTLKNLIKKAETRLLADMDKRGAWNLIERLKSLEEKIDHTYNLDSLILFVNEDVAEYTRMAIPVVDRVIIDDTFATRDLMRSMRMETNYFVLVLSRSRARLIEAVNDAVVREVGAPFPIKNELFDTSNRIDLSDSTRQTNLLEEFFNRVDKEVNAVRNEHRIPTLICGVEENYHVYMRMADDKRGFYETYLNKDRIEKKDHTIVTEAWEVVREYTQKRNDARIEELKKAVSANRFLSDTNDIWRAIRNGRVDTLFIERGLFQPAVMKNDEIVYVPESDRTKKGVIDDIYDEMIEENMRFGGSVVFLPKGELKKFNGFGAITRY